MKFGKLRVISTNKFLCLFFSIYYSRVFIVTTKMLFYFSVDNQCCQQSGAMNLINLVNLSPGSTLIMYHFNFIVIIL